MADATQDLALGDLAATDLNQDNGGLPAGLPMPRNPDLVADLDRRVRVTQFHEPRYPYPVPNGWFVVAEASDLGPGDVRALHYFDRDLVVYRAADGTPRVLDAHCPHLGAHLAVGGRVEGECLRCPFHGWKFDGESGRCVEIPYGEITRIPPPGPRPLLPDARAQPHDLGLVPRQGRATPSTRSRRCPSSTTRTGRPSWSATSRSGCRPRTWPRTTSTSPTSATCTAPTPSPRTSSSWTAPTRGPWAWTATSCGRATGSASACCGSRGTSRSCRRPPRSTRAPSSCAGSSPRPRPTGTAPPSRRPTRSAPACRQDIPIWENKLYRDPPVVTKTEKLILEHRRWSEQFYS